MVIGYLESRALTLPTRSRELLSGSPRQMRRIGAHVADVSINPVTLRRTSKYAKLAERWMDAGPLVSVRRQPYAPQGWCYLNVQEHCLRHGGEVVIGWAMFIEPDAFLCAVHHAVWRSPEGELIDIRLLDDGDSGTMTFVVDPNPLEVRAEAPKVGLTWAATKTPRYSAIGASRSVADALIAEQIAMHARAQDDLFVPILPQFSRALLGEERCAAADCPSMQMPLEIIAWLREPRNHAKVRAALSAGRSREVRFG